MCNHSFWETHREYLSTRIYDDHMQCVCDWMTMSLSFTIIIIGKLGMQLDSVTAENEV